jgi:uncharacterized NAD-dependent epimerase/dehydratase family protein
MLILTEGHLGVFSSKTAAVLLRYRAADIVGLVDAPAAGRRVSEAIPWAPEVPIHATVEAALGLAPEALVIGVAPVGGALPAEMRRHVAAALRHGVDVVSGLHTLLADDEGLRALARDGGARIIDLRRPPAERVIAAGRARAAPCRRVLTVGTDGNVGKMVTSLALVEAARGQGLDARFLATGQTGILVSGRGITVDACVADFAPGAVEALVLAARDAELVVVEGQGSLAHPGYSAVTLALLHGACPDALVLVHHLGRAVTKASPPVAIPPLADLIAAYERAAGLLHPARVVAVALNTHGASASAAREEASRLRVALGLPVADPIRDGCGVLLEAVLGEDREARSEG